jgi:isopenicillin N synthase-like dioxygenase
VEQLRRAAAQVGFLHITGHGIAPAVIERLQAAAKRFFAQPLNTKLGSYIGQSTNHRGYVPEGEETLGYAAEGAKRDRKEAFDLSLDLPAASGGAPMLGEPVACTAAFARTDGSLRRNSRWAAGCCGFAGAGPAEQLTTRSPPRQPVA